MHSMELETYAEEQEICVEWQQFLEFAQGKCSAAAYENWLSPIKVIEHSEMGLLLEVPNVFVQEYLLANFLDDLRSFLPVNRDGEPAIDFKIAKRVKKQTFAPAPPSVHSAVVGRETSQPLKLNPNYRFETYIEGPSNQFVKSAAQGVANRPGESYNPLFIHGGVGLGKTHLLHSIAHSIREEHPHLRVQCISTEAFINELVEHLRNKSIDKMKRFYRSNIDVLLVDDIQFLQNRLNFEEEFCHMFETLINQNRQIVITSDKPPPQLKLSERMTARMEWGLVAHVNAPDLETRVAIIQHKAELKGLSIPHDIAFFIASHIYHNVRQLEGAINRLSAHCRLLNMEISEEVVEESLKEMLHQAPKEKITVNQILDSVSKIFRVEPSKILGSERTHEIALSRQVAMYLAREMVQGSLEILASAFNRKHPTLVHACRTVKKLLEEDEVLRRKVNMIRQSFS